MSVLTGRSASLTYPACNCALAQRAYNSLHGVRRGLFVFGLAPYGWGERVMKKFLVPSIVLSGFVVSSAMAADLPVRKAPSVAPAPVVYDWSGLYIGGHVGWGFAETDITDRTVLGASLAIPTQSFNGDGFLGGAQAGWNYQVGNFVLGAEVDYSFADIKGEVTTSIAATNAVVSRSSDVMWIATSTARLGYTWDRVMVYSKLGAAFAQFDYNNNISVGGASVFSGTASETRVGFTVGTGIEWALAGGWSAKAEYNYMDFGRRTVDFGVDAAGNPVNLDVDQRISTVKAGVNYRFAPLRY
jgi:outer membrane immunogenic protein